MRRMKHAITMASLVAMSAVALYGCGGDNPTATVVAPTPTTIVAAQPTDTVAAMAEPTNTTAAMVEPTETTSAMAEPPVTSTAMAEPTNTTGTSGGGGSNSSDAIALLKNTSTAMKSVKSYHIVITSDAAGVTSTSEGDFMLPDKMRITVDAAGNKTTMIVVDNNVYTQIPGGDSYMQIPGMSNPMSSATTLGFEDFAEDATVVGDETLDGVDTSHLKFSYDTDKAMAAAAGAAGEPTPTAGTTLGRTDAEIWVEKSTGYIHKYKSTSTIAGTTAVSTITYSKFNEDITPPIEKPANIQEMPSIPTVATP